MLTFLLTLIGVANIHAKEDLPRNWKTLQQAEIEMWTLPGNQPAMGLQRQVVCHVSGQTPSGPGGFAERDRRNRVDANKTSSAPAFHLNSECVAKMTDFVSKLFLSFLLCNKAKKTHFV